MPDHFFHDPRWRRLAWPFTIGFLTALAILTVTLAILVRDARRDVGQLTEAARTTEVATCYATARGRPGLIVILRVIAGLAASPDDRLVIDGVIDTYEGDTPTVEECDMLALDRRLNPADFPAPDPPKR